MHTSILKTAYSLLAFLPVLGYAMPPGDDSVFFVDHNGNIAGHYPKTIFNEGKAAPPVDHLEEQNVLRHLLNYVADIKIPQDLTGLKASQGDWIPRGNPLTGQYVPTGNLGQYYRPSADHISLGQYKPKGNLGRWEMPNANEIALGKYDYYRNKYHPKAKINRRLM